LVDKKKTDDVPARLSKNEFVFTADAVRNAGGGDIDKGSAVMQRMMDNFRTRRRNFRGITRYESSHKKCLIPHNNWRVE